MSMLHFVVIGIAIGFIARFTKDAIDDIKFEKRLRKFIENGGE
jgi:uncharacterized membrane-anchored protein YhcB (DUF1043 family)